MRELNEIIRSNREAAKVIPGFKGVGVSSNAGGQHFGGAENVRQPSQRDGCTIETNPRTGARVNFRA